MDFVVSHIKKLKEITEYHLKILNTFAKNVSTQNETKLKSYTKLWLLHSGKKLREHMKKITLQGH